MLIIKFMKISSGGQTTQTTLENKAIREPAKILASKTFPMVNYGFLEQVEEDNV